MNPQLKKGVLELCVLSQLTSKDKYGYELTDAISQEMSIAAGTLYMILKRLKEAGYVETYLLESASGPARKYYHLTDTYRNISGCPRSIFLTGYYNRRNRFSFVFRRSHILCLLQYGRNSRICNDHCLDRRLYNWSYLVYAI